MSEVKRIYKSVAIIIISGLFIHTIAGTSNKQNNKCFTKQDIITNYC